MDRFFYRFFSMKLMTVALVIFLISIGTATFIESAWDIHTARILVYNATWFNLLLLYLSASLIVNIFRYKMWRKEKWSIFLFHIAFLLIILGAAITRFFSFEGMMLIREGETVNYIYSSEPHLWYKINDGKLQYTYQEKRRFSNHPWVNNYFENDVEFPNHPSNIKIEFVDYQQNHIDTLIIHDSIESVALEIVTGGMKSKYLQEGDFLMLGDIAMSFEKKNAMPGIEIFKKGDSILLKTKVPIRYLPMTQMREFRMKGENPPDSLYVEVPTDSLVSFKTMTLYQTANKQFVFKSVLKNAKKVRLPTKKKRTGKNYLILKIIDGGKEKIVELEGGPDVIPSREVFEFNGLIYEMEYGSIPIQLPFAIKCRDFKLERYPGSDVPSSFESEVTIIDKERGYEKDERIFMNNVIDYRGYRFFQSSYDPDEKGTRLSVNHDWWGTVITYIGYLLMGIGMIVSLFHPKGRVKELIRKLEKLNERKAKVMGVLLLLLAFTGIAQEHSHEEHKKEEVFCIMSEGHSKELASLIVQDFQGRFIPYHTLCDQLLRKISHKNKLNGYNAVQIMTSVHMYPSYWMEQPLIYVSSKSNLRDKLGMKGSLISYKDLLNEKGGFKLLEDYREAHQRKEVNRNEYDKKLIKLVERFQVLEAVFSWQYMKLVPVKNDPSRKWYVPLSRELLALDSTASFYALNYFSALDASCKKGNYKDANEKLKLFKSYQREVAGDILPSEELIKKEIAYNEMQIFNRTYKLYLLSGGVLLLLFFLRIFTKSKSRIHQTITIVGKFLIGVAIFAFLYHAYGILLRWQISGHAPWSNAYEAMVFIAWVSMLFGLLFSRRNVVILAGTAILAALMIFVTELNLMDPEITPLQPVLKSYWLMIHVAIITGSYGPLGISFILGILTLVLYIFRTEKNAEKVNLSIKELTYISEIMMTIGLFMLTIGTFLGGVWANESWGRYWGWDPKETWALVAILVYATILHFRFIPGMAGKFLFNASALWGYSSILFTFFGVNFYLVGLHSYAQGEGLGRIPQELIYTVLGFVLFTEIAAIRNKTWIKKENAK